MQGKTVVVTGATNGIGKAIAQNLAGKGANVVVVSRNAAKCATIVDEIKAETGNPNLDYYMTDMSSQQDVQRLIEQLNNDLNRLDVLINNAGAWFTDRKLSVDGVEMTWALNHLGHFMLTDGVLNLMQQTAAKYGDARIINQSSVAHLGGDMHWDNLEFEGNWDTDGKGSAESGANGWSGWAVYSQSKLANVLHAFALARRLEGTGVVANAVHPGVVVTGFAANNGLMYKLAAPVRRLFNRNTPEDGAAPAIYLASAPEAVNISGEYYGPPHKREEVNPLAHDVKVQDKLWDVSMTQINVPA